VQIEGRRNPKTRGFAHKRVKKELRRRMVGVASFPNRPALIRVAGAVLTELDAS
jgi:hypothetical protein